MTSRQEFTLWLVSIFSGLAVLLCVGITTHASNMDKNERFEHVKVACINSGHFTAADCKFIVQADVDEN